MLRRGPKLLPGPVSEPGQRPVGAGNGLVQPGDNPITARATGRSRRDQVRVNPVDPNGLIISRGLGRVFRTDRPGDTWFQIAGPDTGAGTFNSFTNLGGHAPALAFGAPAVNPIARPSNNFLYAGVGGQIWVLFTGGTNWTNISVGLSGGPADRPGPDAREPGGLRGDHHGVFFKADAAQPGRPVGEHDREHLHHERPDLLDPNSPPGRGTGYLAGLDSLAVDWRYAIPVDPTGPSPRSSRSCTPAETAGLPSPIARHPAARRGSLPGGSSYTTGYTDQATGQTGTTAIAIRTAATSRHQGHAADPVVREHRPGDRPAGPDDRRAEHADGRDLRPRHLGDPAGGLPDHRPASPRSPTPGGQAVRPAGQGVAVSPASRRRRPTAPSRSSSRARSWPPRSPPRFRITDSPGTRSPGPGVTPIVNGVARVDYTTVPGGPGPGDRPCSVPFAPGHAESPSARTRTIRPGRTSRLRRVQDEPGRRLPERRDGPRPEQRNSRPPTPTTGSCTWTRREPDREPAHQPGGGDHRRSPTG